MPWPAPPRHSIDRRPWEYSADPPTPAPSTPPAEPEEEHVAEVEVAEEPQQSTAPPSMDSYVEPESTVLERPPSPPAPPPLLHSAVQQRLPYRPDPAVPRPPERDALGFATLRELTDRAIDVLYGEQYLPPARPLPAHMEPASVQTDPPPVCDAAVSAGDELQVDVTVQRNDDLRLGLCAVHDLPLLTVAQLLAAESRLQQLARMLEAEIARAEKEEALRRAEEEGPTDTADVGQFVDTAQWTRRMTGAVERRLRDRHGDANANSAAMFWHRTKLRDIGAPVTRRPPQPNATYPR